MSVWEPGKENYFVFQLMLPEVISRAIDILDPFTRIRRLAPRTTSTRRPLDEYFRPTP